MLMLLILGLWLSPVSIFAATVSSTIIPCKQNTWTCSWRHATTTYPVLVYVCVGSLASPSLFPGPITGPSGWSIRVHSPLGRSINRVQCRSFIFQEGEKPKGFYNLRSEMRRLFPTIVSYPRLWPEMRGFFVSISDPPAISLYSSSSPAGLKVWSQLGVGGCG